MFTRIKERWKKLWTTDNVIDLSVDGFILLFDVLSSPILIIVRLVKHIINMSKDRGAYICQSQSLNLWMEDPNYKSLTSMHIYAWQAGLKTGIYYLRRKPRHQPQQFTIAPSKQYTDDNENGENTYEDDEPCEMCSG